MNEQLIEQIHANEAALLADLLVAINGLDELNDEEEEA